MADARISKTTPVKVETKKPAKAATVPLPDPKKKAEVKPTLAGDTAEMGKVATKADPLAGATPTATGANPYKQKLEDLKKVGDPDALKEGDYGGKDGKPEVKALQEALKDAGHDPGKIDGKYGPNTKEAIKKFQEANKIEPADGKMNKATLEKLKENVKAKGAEVEKKAGDDAAAADKAKADNQKEIDDLTKEQKPAAAEAEKAAADAKKAEETATKQETEAKDAAEKLTEFDKAQDEKDAAKTELEAAKKAQAEAAKKESESNGWFTDGPTHPQDKANLDAANARVKAAEGKLAEANKKYEKMGGSYGHKQAQHNAAERAMIAGQSRKAADAAKTTADAAKTKADDVTKRLHNAQRQSLTLDFKAGEAKKAAEAAKMPTEPVADPRPTPVEPQEVMYA